MIEAAERFLAAHPDLDTVEVILPDTNGVLRGKWLPGSALAKIFEDGVAFPFSLFGLDVWGREVEETGLHIETGDRDGLCWPVAENAAAGALGRARDRTGASFPCTIARARPS